LSTPRQPYEPVEDIPGIETNKLDFRMINPLMHEVLTTTRIALKRRYNFKKQTAYDRELSTFLEGQLLVFASTHASIHILLRYLLRKKYYPPVADAASLAREQVEKIFSIALVLTNPPRWVKQGIRGNWRYDYQAYLLALEEQGQNPRFEEFLTKHYVEYLSNGQRVPTRGSRTEHVIVSDFAKRVLKYQWDYPVGKDPKWFSRRFKKNRGRRAWLSNYFDFPTPGKSLADIKGKTLRKFLYRWHKEYNYFSQFTHVSLGKQMIPYMVQIKSREVLWKTEVNSDNLTERVIYTSFTAVASACTLILLKLRDPSGATVPLLRFWKELDRTSLFSRAIWNIYPRRNL